MKTITLKEAAHILHMHPCSVQQLVKSGQLPGRKVGKQWLFIDEDLLNWIRQGYGKPNQVSVSLPQLNTHMRPDLEKGAARIRENIAQARIQAMHKQKP